MASNVLFPAWHQESRRHGTVCIQVAVLFDKTQHFACIEKRAHETQVTGKLTRHLSRGERPAIQQGERAEFDSRPEYSRVPIAAGQLPDEFYPF